MEATRRIEFDHFIDGRFPVRSSKQKLILLADNCIDEKKDASYDQ